MKRLRPIIGNSLQQRLLVQLAVVFVLLAFGLYWSVRTVAGGVANAAQDGLLGSSAIAIAEQLKLVNGQPYVDLPYSAFATLATSGEERVFYSVRGTDGTLVTGYEILPTHAEIGSVDQPAFYLTTVDDEQVRAVALTRRILSGGASVDLTVTVAQTRDSYQALSAQIALAAALVGTGFLVVAGALGFAAVRHALAPLRGLGEVLSQRQADDFEALRAPVPSEVQPLVDALNGFVERLRITLSTSERFITQAAHRIRTPLAVLSAETELAHRDAQEPDMLERLQRVLDATHQTSRVTSQLLSQAMVAYRSAQREISVVNVRALAESAWHDIDAAADAKTIDVSIDVEPRLALPGDEIALAEALRNLFDNAVKYSPEFAEVRVTASDDQTGNVTIAVEDTGPGIAAGERVAVTETFVRGSDQGDVGGSGLGLAIVRQVVQSHGGRLELDDATGGGLVVRLHLPMTQSG